MKRLLLIFTVCISSVSFGQDNNYSLQFNGSSELNINKMFNGIGGSFSFLAYVYPEAIQMEQAAIITQGALENDVVLEFFDSNTIRGQIYVPGANDIIVSYNYTNDNSFHFVTLTYDESVLKLYIDGVLVDIESQNYLINWEATPYFGSYIGGRSTSYFNGIIDEVSVWSTALTQEQIQDYMDCPPTGTETGLVGYWNFEEGVGTTTADQTSNGNNGTLDNGVTWSTDVPSYNCTVGLLDYNTNQPKELIKIVNLLGQEVEYSPNTILIYQYSDGTSEKKYIIE